jgi:hypothetical protein
MTLHQWVAGGLLAWAAISIAFGPELARMFTRLRDLRSRDAAVPSQGPPPPPRA